MSEQDLAALGAADEGIASPEQEIEQVEQGQVETPPADDSDKPEPAEKTESQKRRERRQQHFQRLKDDADRAETERATIQRDFDRQKQIIARMPEPQESDFQDPFEYAAAKGGWRQAQIAAQSQSELIQEDMTHKSRVIADFEQQRMAARQAAIAEDLPDARAKYADFDKAFAIAQSDVVSVALSELIIESDMALDLAYHLGSNPEVARRLSGMSPVAAARELGRLEATISAPKPKLQSSAPAPISPVKSGGIAGKSPESMNYREFKAYRDAGGKL